MEKNYHEVRVSGSHIKVQTVEANGHEFEVFVEFLGGAKEWYANLVGALPAYLESEHKKPMLLGRGPTPEESLEAATKFLEATFPAWSQEKRDAWDAKVKEEEEAARKAAEEKKKKAAAKKKAAKKPAAKAEPEKKDEPEKKAEPEKKDDSEE